MGDEVRQTEYSREHRLLYRRKVQLSLDVFETMLANASFECERPLTGMEIECNLVDAAYQPAMTNREVLAAIADPAFQTELGAYNIEFNVPPRPLGVARASNSRMRCAPASTPRSPRPTPTVRTS